MKVFQVLLVSFTTFFAICNCVKRSNENDSKKKGLSIEDNDSSFPSLPTSKEDFVRIEPANKLGIQAKVIAHVHRKAKQLKDEVLINREFMPVETYQKLMGQNCKGESKLKWSDCTSNDHSFSAAVTWGVPEPKNKTFTYLELYFNTFKKPNEKGEEEVCILEEVYKKKAYIVLKTFSKLPSKNDSLPRNLKSVDTAHQHELFSFDENFLDLFGDKIDKDLIYDFGEDEYYDRDPPYECFLSIASSETAHVIEDKCDFFCTLSIDNVSEDIMEQILMAAKEKADTDEEEEVEKESHDEL